MTPTERMEQWQHLTVHIRWDATCEQWRSDWPGTLPHDSLHGLFNELGATGWELVSFAPASGVIVDSPLPARSHEHYWAGVRYYAIFKQRQAEHR